MKNFLIATALCVLSLPAFAGGGKDDPHKCANGAHDWPKCTVAQPSTPSTAQGQQATGTGTGTGIGTATATGTGGTGTGTATATSTGGTGTGGTSNSDASGTGGSNDLKNVGNDSSSSSFRALALSLPTPVFTPPMPISGCPNANVSQDAVGVAWGLFSHASGTINTDPCTAIIIYNALLAQCKWQSAQKVLNTLTVRVLPGYEPEKTGMLDLTVSECRSWNAPPPVVLLPPPAPNVVYVPSPPVACTQPPVAVQPKRAVKRKAAPTTCK